MTSSLTIPGGEVCGEQKTTVCLVGSKVVARWETWWLLGVMGEVSNGLELGFAWKEKFTSFSLMLRVLDGKGFWIGFVRVSGLLL